MHSSALTINKVPQKAVDERMGWWSTIGIGKCIVGRRWLILSILELDFRLSHSPNHYNLVVFTKLLTELTRLVNESSSKHCCIKHTKAVVEGSQIMVDY